MQDTSEELCRRRHIVFHIRRNESERSFQGFWKITTFGGRRYCVRIVSQVISHFNLVGGRVLSSQLMLAGLTTRVVRSRFGVK